MMDDLLLLMKQELLVTLLLFALLFVKLSNRTWSNERLLGWMHLLLACNVVAGFVYPATGALFGDMFHTNRLLIFEKNLLALGTLLISLQAHQWLLRHKHVPEFYMLLLSTLLGMYFMLSSNNLLLFYLALELFTIPLAALVNFELEQRRSSEAAFKMIVSSAFASGILLFGISLLYGTTGTISFLEIPEKLSDIPLQQFALVLLLAGFGFKISAVPFHLWTADVYQGAPVSVTAYLSVVSKGAVLFVLAQVLYKVFGALLFSWYNILAVLAVASILIGNLFALRQENIKRFLAFSSIAQVGFILVGMTGLSTEAQTSVVYFVLVYLFSNLAAFGVISVISAATGREQIADYNGLYQSNPLLTWVLALALFSLAGIPPTAGFFGKFFLLLAGAGIQNYLLVGFAALNMVVSLYYYLRVVRAMFMQQNDAPLPPLALPWQPALALAVCTAGIVITGIVSGAYNYIYELFLLQ
jgi:NADH-quinone oxidoreductase subunit N